MSVKKVEGHIDAIERKLNKSIKIAEKGSSLKLADVAKLGRKTNSIVSEIGKINKELDVGFSLAFGVSVLLSLFFSKRKRDKKNNKKDFLFWSFLRKGPPPKMKRPARSASHLWGGLGRTRGPFSAALRRDTDTT